MNAAKWVTETAIPNLRKRSVWLPIVASVAVIALVWSMYAYVDSLEIRSWFSTHPQSPIDAYVGGVEIEGSRWFWWRFLTITAVEYDSYYYHETDAWVELHGATSGLGSASEEDAVRFLRGVDLSPAVGYRMHAPKVNIIIRIERYRPCTENLNNTEIPLGIGISTRLLWIERTVVVQKNRTYNNIGT